MPLFEYHCEACRSRFEEITSSSAPDAERGKCPKCGNSGRTRRLISRFAVGGQGDLRESTWHGCHSPYSGGTAHDHAHSHGHDHGNGHGGDGGEGHGSSGGH